MTVREKAVMLRRQGADFGEISRALGVSRTTVRRFTDPVYEHRHREQNRERERARHQHRADELVELRARVDRLELELRNERRKTRLLEARQASRPPFSLTELHEWWLARHSPDEIRRIAGWLEDGA